MSSVTVKPALRIHDHAVMSHFCWSYSNSLLQKLKKLIEEKRVFDGHVSFLDMAEKVTEELQKQVGGRPADPMHERQEDKLYEHMNEFVAHAEEFLAIFEKK